MYSDAGPGDPEDYNFFSLFSDVSKNSTRFWMLVLYGLIRSNNLKQVVEIGVFNGVTTSLLARAVKKNGGYLHCYDIDPQAIHRAQEQLSQNGLLADVSLATVDSHKIRPTGPVSLVFIDGDHSYEGVKGDWEIWEPWAEIICFHDTADERIALFLHQTFPRDGWEFVNFFGDCGFAIARRRR